MRTKALICAPRHEIYWACLTGPSMAPLPQLCQLHRQPEYRGPKENASRETNFETAQTVNISFMRLP